MTDKHLGHAIFGAEPDAPIGHEAGDVAPARRGQPRDAPPGPAPAAAPAARVARPRGRPRRARRRRPARLVRHPAPRPHDRLDRALLAHRLPGLRDGLGADRRQEGRHRRGHRDDAEERRRRPHPDGIPRRRAAEPDRVRRHPAGHLHAAAAHERRRGLRAPHQPVEQERGHHGPGGPVGHGDLSPSCRRRQASRSPDYTAAAKNPSSIGLPPEANGDVEGWLFPATYDFTSDMSAKDQLSKMVAQTITELQSVNLPQVAVGAHPHARLARRGRGEAAAGPSEGRAGVHQPGQQHRVPELRPPPVRRHRLAMPRTAAR